MTDGSRHIEFLSMAALEAVAMLWRRERRQLATSFSGTSMLPAITPGQRVIVECGVEPALGDVVVFRFDERVGVHRLVARGSNWLLTWGDANSLPDEPIPLPCVIGTIRNVPAARRSWRRALLLRLILISPASIEKLSVRIRRLYRVRGAWSQGPTAFMGKAVRILLRRNPIPRVR